MKNFRYFLCIFLFGFVLTTVKAQDNRNESLGLPGDNLNLYAVMKLFQESETLEGFEKNLNDENALINNLDLDGDGNIDYIKVEDNVDGNVHTIVLKDAITPHENQDVAVFTVQRFANNEVQIQLIGDEELYGKNYIIEPNYEGDDSGATPNPGYTGNTVVVNRTTYVEVAAWPVIHYIYLPSYAVWHSPWYFGYYPPYWHTWRPFYWDYYYGYHHNYNHYYYGNYRHVNHYRYAQWNDNYYNSRRSHSQVVSRRQQEGRYKDTYSRPDTRREGAELYKRTQTGSNMNPGRNSSARPGVDKQSQRRGTVNPSGRPGMDKQSPRRGTPNSSARPGTNKSSSRPDVTRPSNRRDVNKQGAKSGVNRSASRPDVNKSSPNQRVNKRAPRTGNNKSSARPSQSKNNSRQDKTGTRKDNGRK